MQNEQQPDDHNNSIGLRAAQYVRMSTTSQKYSIENQAAAIAAYAVQRNLKIVETYTDHGRSGLRLDGRQALHRLIKDVQSGQADFEIILVYDISRWGRFQDVDESAYYEFMCKNAGVRVAYCAEQFENDGSLVSAILKNLGRVEAGNFSRRLSTKVFDGQCRGASLGFWQGGPAGYGFRRQMIDQNGKPKCNLEYGQSKSLKTDRVILVPGPLSEQKIIKRIFKSFVIQKKSRTQIAADLNANNIPNARGKPWTSLTIHNILINEKYVGHAIYGRRSNKLKQKLIRNSPDQWIRHDNAFKAIIAPELFAKAQKRIQERPHRMPDQEMLDLLSALWRKKKHLSYEIILAAKGLPNPTRYVFRFGSLVAAYERIGFRLATRYHYTEARMRIETIIGPVVEDIVSNVERLGGSVTYLSELHLLTINGKITVTIGVATCVSDGATRARRWQLRAFKYKKADLSLVLKMNESNTKVQAYYLMPTVHIPLKQNYRLRMASRVFSEEYRHDDLGAFYRMWTRKEALPRRKSA